MTAQLALDGRDVGVIPRQRGAGTDPSRDRSAPSDEHDRWRVSGLFVQPREIDDDERQR